MAESEIKLGLPKCLNFLLQEQQKLIVQSLSVYKHM